MNHDDLKTLEDRLGIVLPKAYRQTLLAGPPALPTFDVPYFYGDPKELLIANLQLRMSPGDRFAGAPWPKDFVCVGSDGCGNYYYIEAGDAACAVRFYDHEVDAFEEIAADLPSYFVYLSDLHDCLASLRDQKNADETRELASPDSSEAMVARTIDPLMSVLDPISLEEWTALVAVDPELRMQEFRVLRNPFSDEEIKCPTPGAAIFASRKDDDEFEFVSGRVIVRRPTAAALAKLRQLAEALNAGFFSEG